MDVSWRLRNAFSKRLWLREYAMSPIRAMMPSKNTKKPSIASYQITRDERLLAVPPYLLQKVVS